MICEKCAQKAETFVWSHCNTDIVKLGPYCYMCGGALTAISQEEDGAVDIENRILCSDGNCIGVVENGVCKLCGKTYVPES